MVSDDDKQASASPRIKPEESPTGLRAREILDCMRQQRESFLASIQPTEAEVAARKSLENPDSTPSENLPTFSSSEAQVFTKKINDSINKRKERLARFSSSDPKLCNTKSTSCPRKITHSLSSASTTDNSSFYSNPSLSSGYDSDGSLVQAAPYEVPLSRSLGLGLEEILENSVETESEAGSESSPSGGIAPSSFNTSLLSTADEPEGEEDGFGFGRGEDDEKHLTRDRDDSDREGDEDSISSLEENEIAIEVDFSDGEAEESQASKPVGAPMMTLFGYTSFDESVTRPPLLVHCDSLASYHESSMDNNSTQSRLRRVTRTSSVVSGNSTFSGPAAGPLGHTVEQRKKALLRTLTSTVTQLEQLRVDVSSELSSVVSSCSDAKNEEQASNPAETDTSSFTSIGISSASSYYLTDDDSETSGWQSPEGCSRASLLLRLARSEEERDQLEEPKDEGGYNILDDGSISTRSNMSSSHIKNPLGDMGEESDAEPKLLCSPPSPVRKPANRKVSTTTRDTSQEMTNASFQVGFKTGKKTKQRSPQKRKRRLDPISISRGNLWNISKSSGLSFMGPVTVNRSVVYRSPEYLLLSSEQRCNTRGGLMDLALHSGMTKTQMSPLRRKLSPPKVNGRQRWKLKARGGHYHVAVWTNMTKNMLSPSSIFRDPQPAPCVQKPPSGGKSSKAAAARARLKVVALGSFYYLANETRKECV